MTRTEALATAPGCYQHLPASFKRRLGPPKLRFRPADKTRAAHLRSSCKLRQSRNLTRAAERLIAMHIERLSPPPKPSLAN